MRWEIVRHAFEDSVSNSPPPRLPQFEQASAAHAAAEVETNDEPLVTTAVATPSTDPSELLQGVASAPPDGKEALAKNSEDKQVWCEVTVLCASGLRFLDNHHSPDPVIVFARGTLPGDKSSGTAVLSQSNTKRHTREPVWDDDDGATVTFLVPSEVTTKGAALQIDVWHDDGHHALSKGKPGPNDFLGRLTLEQHLLQRADVLVLPLGERRPNELGGEAVAHAATGVLEARCMTSSSLLLFCDILVLVARCEYV